MSANLPTKGTRCPYRIAFIGHPYCAGGVFFAINGVLALRALLMKSTANINRLLPTVYGGIRNPHHEWWATHAVRNPQQAVGHPTNENTKSKPARIAGAQSRLRRDQNPAKQYKWVAPRLRSG